MASNDERDRLFARAVVELGFVDAELVSRIQDDARMDGACLAEILERNGMISARERRDAEATVPVPERRNPRRTLKLPVGGTAVLPPSSCEMGALRQGSGCPDAGDRDPEPSGPVTLEQPGRYALLDRQSLARSENGDAAEIGRGGLGRVLLAMDTHAGRPVAVKELLPEAVVLDDAATERFLREARVTARLEHPSIVPVYEVGRKPDGTLYYTMRVVRGRTLGAALEACGSLAERLRLLGHFVDVAEAVAYAHSRGVIHRDVKPDNVMLGEFGETVVLDWGIAKLKDRSDDITRERDGIGAAAGLGSRTTVGTVMGTRGYMSPEQLKGRHDEVDERSDVYSLGAILYEILTGRVPVYATREGRDSRGDLLDILAPIAEIARDAPRDLAAVAEKALRARKEDRYASAKELAEEVEAFRNGGRISTYDYGSVELLKRFVAKNRALSVSVGLLLVGVLTGSPALFKAYRDADRARAAAEASERGARLNLATAFLEKSRHAMGEKNYLGAMVFAAGGLAQHPGPPPGGRGTRPPFNAGDPGAVRLGLVSDFVGAYRRSYLTFRGGLDGHAALVYGLAVSPDGSRLASASYDGTVGLWSLAAGRREAAFPVGRDYVMAAAFSADGRRLASGSRDGLIRVWEVAGRVPVGSITTSSGVLCVAYSPVGEALASAHLDGTVRFFDSALGNSATFRAHRDAALALSFSPDGRRLASAGMDGTAAIWDVTTRREAARLRLPYAQQVRAVRFAPDGRGLAVAGSDHLVTLFDGEGYRPFAVLRGHEDDIWSLAYSPDGRTLASASKDGTIRLWDVAGRSEAEKIRVPSGSARNVVFTPDGRGLLAAGSDGRIRRWQFGPDDGYRVLADAGNLVFSGAVAPDGSVAIATRSGVLTGNPADAEPLRVLMRSPAIVWQASFSRRGDLVAAADATGTIHVVRRSDGRELHRLRADSGTIFSVCFSEPTTLVSGHKDGMIRIWELDQGVEPLPLRAHDGGVLSVAVSPDGTLLASGGKDAKIRLWHLRDQRLLHVLDGHSDWVSRVAFSADGTRLLSAGKDGMVRVWDPRSGAALVTLSGHAGWVNDASFSPDGRRIASASDDGTMRIWDASSGDARIAFPLSGQVTVARFTPDGRYLIANDGSRIVRISADPTFLDATPDILRQRAIERTGIRLEGLQLRETP